MILARNPQGPLSLNVAHGDEKTRGTFLRLASNHQQRFHALRYESNSQWDPMLELLDRLTPLLLAFPEPIPILELLARPTPSLTSIILKHKKKDILVCRVLGPGPSFERVDLWNTALPWDSERLRGLRSLVLDLDSSSPSFPIPPQVVQILRESPRLTWLQLQLYGSDEDYEIPDVLDREVIHLPKLAYIHLHFPQAYHKCITELLSSDSCDEYDVSDCFDVSLFASDDGVHMQHCLKKIFQDLAYLDVQFAVEANDTNDIVLSLTGNSHSKSESCPLSGCTLNIALLWSEGRSDRTSWSMLCWFLNRHMKRDVHLRLTLDASRAGDNYVPASELLELMESLGSFTSILFGEGSISHHFIDLLESRAASHQSNLSKTPFQFITFDEGFTADENGLRSLSRFITSLAEFRRTTATVTVADQVAKITIMAPRSLVEQLKSVVGDEVAAQVRWKVRSGYLRGQETLREEWRECAGYNNPIDDRDSDVVESP